MVTNPYIVDNPAQNDFRLNRETLVDGDLKLEKSGSSTPAGYIARLKSQVGGFRDAHRSGAPGDHDPGQ